MVFAALSAGTTRTCSGFCLPGLRREGARATRHFGADRPARRSSSFGDIEQETLAMRNAALKIREIGPDVYLPFGRHVTDTGISLTTRALLTGIRLDGTSFETAETADLNDLHAKLNLTLRNVADPRLALWTHLVRRRTSDYPAGTFRSTFAASLDAQYRDRLRQEALFRNDLYLTLVWHPGRATTDVATAFFKQLGRRAAQSAEVDSDALKRLDDARRDMVAALERYGAHTLELVESNG